MLPNGSYLAFLPLPRPDSARFDLVATLVAPVWVVRRSEREPRVAVGFEGVSVDPTHEVADGMHSAIVRARKPLR